MSKSAQDIQDETIRFGDMGSSLGLLLRLAQVQVFEGFFANLTRHGLKPGEFTVLWLIGENPGARQGAIAERLRIKPAHMTKLVQRMVATDMIARQESRTDRRSVHLRLTDKGREFLARVRPAFLDFVARENTQLSPDDFARLIALLQKFNGMEPQT
jgi:DNA-binding MarR family transcriptional regulator